MTSVCENFYYNTGELFLPTQHHTQIYFPPRFIGVPAYNLLVVGWFVPHSTDGTTVCKLFIGATVQRGVFVLVQGVDQQPENLKQTQVLCEYYKLI